MTREEKVMDKAEQAKRILILEVVEKTKPPTIQKLYPHSEIVILFEDGKVWSINTETPEETSKWDSLQSFRESNFLSKSDFDDMFELAEDSILNVINKSFLYDNVKSVFIADL
jgi:hypothetical protein